MPKYCCHIFRNYYNRRNPHQIKTACLLTPSAATKAIDELAKMPRKPRTRLKSKKEQRKGLCQFCPESKRRLVNLTRHWTSCIYYPRHHAQNSAQNPEPDPALFRHSRQDCDDGDYLPPSSSPGDSSTQLEKASNKRQKTSQTEEPGEEDDEDSYFPQDIDDEGQEVCLEFVETCNHEPFQPDPGASVDGSPRQPTTTSGDRPTNPRDILRRSIFLDERDVDEMSVLPPRRNH